MSKRFAPAIALFIAPMLVRATTIEMDVNGLVCAFCAQGISKTLRGFPATSDVVVSLEKKLVAVATKEGEDIPDENLRRAVIYGSAMGSFAVEKFSVQRLLEIDRTNIAARVADFRRLVAFEEEVLA